MEWNAYNAAFEALERMEKEAFIPMPGGQPPADPAAAGGMPMDPAMAAGGGMPMDPAMMGAPMDPAMAGGAPPMDPAMMGGAPPMDPAMMGAPPPDPAADAAVYDMIVQAVRQVLQEMGIEPKEEKGGKSESKGDGDSKGDRLGKLEKTVETIAAALGIPVDGEGEEGGGPDAATGMSAGSGMADPGVGAMPMMGPLDPMAGAGMADAAAMSGMPMPSPTEMPKQGGFRPLDDRSDARNIAAALKRLRR